MPLTARLAEVEAQENEDNSGNDEEKSDEVEFLDVLPERLPFMRVEVQEEEQQGEADTSGGPVRRQR